ncbi:sigma-54-dependent transcriptional regulator [Saccharospirillum salsuginis]|uniref:Acetoacetate metabolism regulatory protein AtoC n=1 Tax=Saccharospirillum salsuginis TaxID=418750 RepID=A0A918NIT3_9GAMM|nr:sigma-54 dependent transcriptional regulator [Saccharospirillum salsuginis]GGX70758.1 acetoacetate metabolism regulatory protein AtoC [Saccharospirillum salsuginis]
MPEHRTALVVEDDPDLAELLVEELTDEGFTVSQAESTEAALPQLHEQRPLLVVSDLKLPGADGLAMLEHCRRCDWSPLFVMITAYGTIGQAVDALKLGADEFLTKPLSMDHFLIRIRKLMEHRALDSEVARYRKLFEQDDFHGIIGQSPAARRLFRDIQRTGQAEGPVLILGESGSGKELVARALHAESQRSQGPFIAVNCAGIPTELMESEFFGHAAGAFTGAKSARAGLFQQADGGTLMLDEIAELPMALQSKLLRVLQEHRLRRVGEDRERTVDVRILAATHQDLEQRVQAGTFRQDLYYRLETFTLTVPPLRERSDDVLQLADHFLKATEQPNAAGVEGLAESARQVLLDYPFPGNVRELRNAIERAVAFCDGPLIEAEDLPDRMREASRHADAKPVRPEVEPDGDALPTLNDVQRQYIHRIMAHTGGNKRQAASILGVTRRTLYRWLSEES